MKKNQLLVTTSWDDGHKDDLKVAALLNKYGLSGTFYVSPKSRLIQKSSRLTNTDIKFLSKSFEVGAHTLTHPKLTSLNNSKIDEELMESKSYLESVIGKKVLSFCYPYGDFDLRVRRHVKLAGFEYARTTKRYQNIIPSDSLLSSTTMHAFRHWSDILNIAKHAKFNPIRTARYLLDWSELAISLFNESLNNGEIYHLWGHSWEIEKNNDWERLEKVFKYIAAHSAHIKPVINSYNSSQLKPKLLLASSFFYPHVGGLERYEFEMAKAAIKAGYEVVAITSGNADELAIENIEGVKVYRLREQFRISNTPISLLWWTKIKRIISEEKPDIVNTHTPVPFLSDLVIYAAKDIPRVITYHSGSMKKRNLLLDRIIDIYEYIFLQPVLRRADHIICSSDSTRNGFLGKYKDISSTITPGVDTKLFTRIKNTPTNNRLLFIGNFSYAWKGLDYLKGAVSLIPDVELTVVGYGQHIPARRTKYLGTKSGKELVHIIQSASIVILPSISESESFGMVLAEAMACGIPVIGSNIGGIPSLIKDHINGLLVEPRNPESIAAAIEYIRNNPDEANRMANNAHDLIVRSYTWEIINKSYIAKLQELIRF